MIKRFEGYEFKGNFGNPAICNVYIRKEHKDDITVVLMERQDNFGVSVTNFIEHLATEVMLSILVPEFNACWRDVRWFEHYPDFGQHPETWDEVELQWNPSSECFVGPSWVRVKDDVTLNRLREIRG